MEPLTPRDASSLVPPAVHPGVGAGSNSASDPDPGVSDTASFAPACAAATAAAAFSLGTTLSCLSSHPISSILRPAPLRPNGTTDSQGRLLPGAARGPLRRGGWVRFRFRSRSRCLRRCLVCSRLRRCRCRLFPCQPPIKSRLLPPSMLDSCTPPPLRHLTEPQNRPCRNKLRDRILSPGTLLLL